MRYLIVQDWKNTSNNHAGMKYLALQLHKLYPDTIAVYIVPDYDGSNFCYYVFLYDSSSEQETKRDSKLP